MALKRVVSSRLNRPSKPEFFVPPLELPFFYFFKYIFEFVMDLIIENSLLFYYIFAFVMNLISEIVWFHQLSR